jgi:hypothetical protein
VGADEQAANETSAIIGRARERRIERTSSRKIDVS